MLSRVERAVLSSITARLTRSAFTAVIAVSASWSNLPAQRPPSSASPAGPAAIRYPAARTVSVVDDYFGTRVADPYRWFEVESPETKRWAAAQTAFAQRFLRDRSLSPWIASHIREYLRPFDAVAAAEMLASRAEALRLEKAIRGTHEVLVAGRSTKHRRRVLLDPVHYGTLARISRFRVARDQQHVIVELALGGSDWKQALVVRVADGVVLPERIDGLLFAQPVWTRDGNGFFYVRYQRPGSGERMMFRSAAVLYHTLGAAPASDRLILQTPVGNSDIVLSVSLSTDSRYVIVSEGSGADSDEIGWVDSRLHVLDLGSGTQPTLSAPLLQLSATRDAAYRVIRTSGTDFTVLTDHGAPRHRLVTIDLANPAPEHWRDVIPESADMLQSVRVINTHLVAVYLRNVQPMVRVFTLDGRLVREIHPPPMSRIFAEPGAADSLLQIESESYLQSPMVTQHDLTTGASKTLWATTSTFSAGDYVQTQRWFVSRDGTRVPIFLVHRKDIVLDGSHPTLLYGYGASGTSQLPRYAPDILAWLALGGVYAMPSLRGGGEFGRAWYDAATLGRKQTTFDDFIAAAEFLIAEGYTSPTRLAIQGESNGGQLVAAVITQRPDLFAVAIAGVPQTDNLRYDRGRHRGQFGSPADSAHFPFLFAYSPLHRVRPGTCFPATLITTALNDNRSPAWLAMKFAATLQSAQSCGRPVLLQAHLSGGHYGNRAPESSIDDATDVLTFIASQLGMRPPSPPPSAKGDSLPNVESPDPDGHRSPFR